MSHVDGLFCILCFSNLKDNADAPVDGPEVRLDEDGEDGVGPGALAEGLAQAEGAGVEAEEGGEGGGAQHAALVERRQDGDLVVVGPPEAAPVVQVQRVRLVAERLEGSNNPLPSGDTNMKQGTCPMLL